MEKLETGPAGVHAGLASGLPTVDAGVALYSEWEMDKSEWAYWHRSFLGKSAPETNSKPIR